MERKRWMVETIPHNVSHVLHHQLGTVKTAWI